MSLSMPWTTSCLIASNLICKVVEEEVTFDIETRHQTQVVFIVSFQEYMYKTINEKEKLFVYKCMWARGPLQ